ncbi:MAG TPA: RICIN domain-containing protein [Bryobacteraceae bacterium]
MGFAQTAAIAGCNIFPANNVWNTPVDKLPVDKNSASYVASMNATKSTLYPIVNSAGWGMPFNTVTGSQPKSSVYFYYGDSDPGPYPLGDNIKIQSGSDHHAIIVDTTNCVLYELFNVSHPSGWMAGSGAVFPLNSNTLRPAGWTSADAAGLPIFPGVLRVEEVLAGHINHALRITADHTRNQYIWPARHAASRLTGAQYPPMGQRFRLKAGFDITGYAPQAQVILQALKTYGAFLADNGPSWDMVGIGDPRWDDAALNSIKRINGSNFEAVDESSLVGDPNSAQVRSGANPLPTGWVNVVAKSSGKCLDVKGGVAATAPTTQNEQWTCLGSAQTNQHFQFVPVNGGYKIIARNSSLALQPTGGTSATPGAILEQWGYEGQSYQIWRVAPNSDGTYAISPMSNTTYCVDVRGNSLGNGAFVHVWGCHGLNNQRWSLIPVK